MTTTEADDRGGEPLPAPAPEPAARPPRRRRWLRRLLILALILYVVRTVLLAMLPSLLDGAAEEQGLRIGYERLDVSLLGLDVELWHLDVTPRDAANDTPPLMHLEYVRADVAVLSLLVGDLVVRRAEVDGLDMDLELDEDGRLVGLPAGDADPTDPDDDAPERDAPEDADADADEADAEPASLRAPLALDALRVQQLRVALLDRSVDPPVQTLLRGEVRLSDLGSTRRPARLDVLLSADGLLDSLRIDGRYEADDDHGRLDLDLALRGLRPGALTGHLAPAGVAPAAEALDLDLALEADVTRAAPGAAALAVEAALSGLELRADGAAELTLERVGLSIASLGSQLTHIARVDVGPLRAQATRRPDGRLLVGGLLLGGPTAPSTDDAPAADEPAGDPGVLRLDELVVSDVQARWRDEGFDPPTQLDVILDTLRLADVDTADPTLPVFIDMDARVPGVLGALTVDGDALPFGDDGGRADLDILFTGLTPSGLGGYLADAGVRSEIEDGRLELALDAAWTRDATGALTAQASLGDMVLFDSEAPRLHLGRLELRDVVVPGEGGGPLHIASVALDGTRLAARKDADGLLHVAGFVLGDPAVTSTRVPADDAPAAPRASGAPAAPASDPAAGAGLRLDRLRWTATVDWDDSSVDPLFALRVPDLDLQVSDLVVDPGASFPLAATLVARLGVDELLEELRLTAHVAPESDAARLGVELRARGLHGEPLQPLLASSGMVSELDSAEFSLGVDGTVSQADGTTRLAAQLADLSFRDGDRELLAVDLVRVSEARFGAGASIDDVLVTGARVHARRDADGTLHALGLRIPPAGDGEPTSDDAAPTTAPADGGRPASDPPATSAAPGLQLASLRLDSLDVHWSDTAVDPPAQLTLSTRLELSDLAPGPGATPAQVELALAVDGLLDDLGLRGEVVPDPRAFVADLALRGRVPGYDAVLGYLPPGVRPNGDAVELDGHLSARALTADDGSLDVTAELGQLSLTDASGHGLGLQAVRLRAPRLDTAGGQFEIETMRLDGAWARAHKDLDGALNVLGLSVASAPDAASPATAEPRAPDDTAAVEPGDAAPTEAVASVDPTTPVAPPAAPPAASMPTQGPPPAAVPAGGFAELPQLVLEDLGLHVSELVLTDARHPDAPPLALRDLRFENDDALVLDGEDPEASPAMGFTLTGSAAPILDGLELRLVLAPFAVERMLGVHVHLSGIRGAALTEVLPDLAETLDASELEDGHLHFGVEARVGGRRRHPLEWIPGTGVSLDVVVKDVAIRDGAEGEPLVGLRGLRLDAPRIVPSLNLVHVRSLEITEPIAHLEQSERGLRVADVVLLAPPADEGADEGAPEVLVTDAEFVEGEDTEGELVVTIEDTTPAEPAETASGPALDLRLDSFVLGDIDVSLVDHTTTPSTHLPLEALDVSVLGFSTRALVEPLPVRFQLLLGLGDVPDPRATAAEPDATIPLASEISVDGRLTLAPHLVGWVKASVDALRLVGFKGAASNAGVEIEDGTLDARFDLRFAEDGSLDTRNDIVFRDLDLSEPEDGLISSLLSLPAPLDTVVFLLRDDSAAIKIPLNVSVDADGLSLGEITSVATATLGRLIGNAVANSPLRVVGGLGDAALFMGDMVGLGSDEPEAVAEQPPLDLLFEPVGTQLVADVRAQLDELGRRLVEDEQLVLTLRHGLGQRDLSEASVRASPPPEVCLQLVSRLRTRKTMLLAAQDLLADEVRAAHATGQLAAGRQATRRLVDAQRELGLIERALDGVLDVLRPGAESRAERRTRDACQSIAALRLDGVRRYLVETVDLTDASRIRVVRPRFDDDDLPDLGRVSAALGSRATP